MTTHYWFKRRRYGKGVVPASKEAWALTLCYTGLIIVTSFFFVNFAPITATILYIICIFASGAVFIYIIIRHSPPLKWRWGKKSTDNPQEDW